MSNVILLPFIYSGGTGPLLAVPTTAVAGRGKSFLLGGGRARQWSIFLESKGLGLILGNAVLINELKKKKDLIKKYLSPQRRVKGCK